MRSLGRVNRVAVGAALVIVATVASPSLSPPTAAGAGVAAERRLDELLPAGDARGGSLGPVVVEVGRLGASVTQLDGHRAAAVDAAARSLAAERSLEGVRRDELSLALQRERTVGVLAAADGELAGQRRLLRAYAVESYVAGERTDLGADVLHPAADPAPEVVRVVGLELLDRHQGASRRRRAAAVRLDELDVQMAELAQRRDQVTAERDSARAAGSAAEASAAEVQRRLAREVWAAPVTGTDLPVVALDAYVTAASTVGQWDPGCGLQWWHLAAVGRVETEHGTFGGNRLGPDARTTGRILGPVLDGNGVAAVRDTDRGRLDGDPVWDRPVGPMQFIPGTWAALGRDGDGDAVADPHDLHDAALSAGALLCRSAGDVSDAPGYRRALLGYNRSTSYGATVMAEAERYRSAVVALPPG